METYLLLLLIPLVWPFIAKAIWHKTITWPEMGLNVAIVAITVSLVYLAGMYTAMSDVEIMNGQVSGKEKVKVSCSHSYKCRCYTSCSGSGSSKSCTEHCSTCYDHPYDFDWNVYTTVGTIEIDRIDRQGTKEPARWTAAQIGQPVARTHSYQNYIKAVPESLFHNKLSLVHKYPGLLPAYPQTVYDYHYTDRVLLAGKNNVPDLDKWNYYLAMALRDLGPAKQANAIIVFVNTADEAYLHALEAHWLGGKKNDVVLVIGTTNYPKIEWVQVMSWTKAELFKVQLRDAILALKTIDRPKVIKILHDNIKDGFVRRPMADFEYLKNEIEPPMWVLIFGFILGIVGSVGLSIWFHREDPFN